MATKNFISELIMRSRRFSLAFFTVSLLLLGILAVFQFCGKAGGQGGGTPVSPGGKVIKKREIKKPDFVRGIHLSAWAAGSPKLRVRADKLLQDTELNTVVIALKEYDGDVYISGVPDTEAMKTYVRAIPDFESYLSNLKSRGIFTSGRIVVFKDNRAARQKPEWAVKDPEGNIWLDRKKIAWLDPYNREVWDYILNIAERAAEMGFDEIQFDYIRYPSDGNTRLCRYSVKHTSSSAVENLKEFLREANRRLKPYGVDISICVFGLTTTSPHDMGIGQKIVELTDATIDAVCPMVYPSHYYPGEYGLADPNSEPYKTVYYSISGAVKRLGDGGSKKLRPYLQDFSLGRKYTAREVREQIRACYDSGVYQWLLWDPKCKYTEDALETKPAYEDFVKNFRRKLTAGTSPYFEKQ